MQICISWAARNQVIWTRFLPLLIALQFACIPFIAIANEDEIPSSVVVATEVVNVDANSVSDEIKKEVGELLNTEIPETKVEVLQSRAAKALMAGHGKSLQKVIADIVTRIGVANDPNDVTVRINADPEVNARVFVKDKGAKKVDVIINAGLLGYVKNQDELAFVLGHEMTHLNTQLLRQKDDAGRMKRFVDSLPAALRNAQAEEVRADLGAAHRAIQGGFNPWAGYDLFKRFADEIVPIGKDGDKLEKIKRTVFSAIRMHPDPQLRMGLVKGYLTSLQGSQDLGKVTARYNEFPTSFKALNWRIKAYSALADLNKAKAAMLAGAGVAAQVMTALLVSPDTADAVGALLRPGVDIVGAVSSVAEYMSSPGDLGEVPVEIAKSTSSDVTGGVKTGAIDQILEVGRYLKNLPAEKSASILAGLVGSGATARWAINKHLRPGKLERAYRAFIETHPYVHNRIAEQRTLKAIELYKELHGKGVFDRTEDLERALNSNHQVTSLFVFDGHISKMAKKHKLDEDEFASYVGKRAESESLQRQLLLQNLAEEALPKMSQERARSFAKVLAKTSTARLLHPEVRASTERMVEQFKTRFPQLRFSTEIERMYAALKSVESGPNSPKVGRSVELETVFRQAEELLSGRHTVNGPLKNKDGKPSSLATRGSRLGGVSNIRMSDLIYQNLDAWLAEVQVPGERGREASALFIRAFHSASLSGNEIANQMQLQDAVLAKFQKELPEKKNVRLASLFERLTFQEFSLSPNGVWEKLQRVVGVKKVTNYAEKKRALGTSYDLLLSKVGEAQSIVELDELTRSRVVDVEGFGIYEHPVSSLHQHVAKNPQLLKTKADIDRLLASEYMWNQMGTGSPNLDYNILKEMQKRIGRAGSKADMWKYRPEASDKLQKRIIERLDQLGELPNTTAEKIELWQKLVGRGATTTTDKMFSDLYAESDAKTRRRLREISHTRIWEPQLRAKLLKDQIAENGDYKFLVDTSREVRPARDIEKRRIQALRSVIAEAQKEFDNRGQEYDQVVEGILRDIRSTATETRFAERYRGPIGSGETDLTMRALSSLVERLRDLNHEEKWQFILWLRGERPSMEFIEELFPVVGGDRILRMYSLLPDYRKALVIDNILDAKDGLLPSGEVNGYWGRKIVDHLIGASKSSDPESLKSRQIAREILEAYLESFDGAGGNKAQRTLVLSYMLASKTGDGSNGKVLKQVLEAMGASGVKIGQFLVASDILGDEENRILRELQDRANVPERSRIYADLKRAMAGKEIPGKVDDLLGAASVKYAMKAFDLETENPFVLKVLREEATSTIDQQFRKLRLMADSLVKRHGGKYDVLKSIIRASDEAVQRELKLVNEVSNSTRAAEIYKKASDFEVPRETLLDDTLIKSDFASGGSIHDLDVQTRSRVANRIMEFEGQNLFSDSEEIVFDPDRHPGNYKIEVVKGGDVRVRPIDFGQVLSVTSKERQQVIDLFAQAAILDRSGSTSWSVERIGDILDLSSAERGRLKAALKGGFPASNPRTGLASYYTLLAALEKAGKPQPIQFFDFARAVVQHNQYEGMVVDGLVAQGLTEEAAREQVKTPAKLLREKVQESFQRQIGQGREIPDFSKMDEVRIVWNRGKRIVSDKLAVAKTNIGSKVSKNILDPSHVGKVKCAEYYKSLKSRVRRGVGLE